MRDMSRTIMTQLETLRAQSDRQRGTNMVMGLGAFVQGSSHSTKRKRQHAKRKRSTGSKATLKESDLPNRTVKEVTRCGVPDALAGPEEIIKDSAWWKPQVCQLIPYTESK